MKIWSFTTVKDEADIIESFVRYHMNIFDGMVISNNCSNDNTLLILKKLKAEGLNIDILEDDNKYFDQCQKRAELLNYTKKKYKPDYIFPLDADEFVCCNSNKNPRYYIGKLDENKLYKYKMINFVPTPDDKISDFIPSRLVNKIIYKGTTIATYKCILSKKIYNLKDFELFMGCHSAKTKECDELPYEVNEKLFLAHYPVRSKKQLENKIILGRLNNASLHSRSEGLGFHQYEILDEIIKNNDLPDKIYYEIAKNYGIFDKENIVGIENDPINLSFCKNIKIKYAENSKIKLLSNVITISEAVIDHMREEIKEKNNKIIDIENSLNKYMEDNKLLNDNIKSLLEENERLKKINNEQQINYNLVVNSKTWKLRNKVVRIIGRK